MVAKHGIQSLVIVPRYNLAKILMVAKLRLKTVYRFVSYNLAKILMVAKHSSY